MTKHPLDAVESALVDASNALQDAMPEQSSMKLANGSRVLFGESAVRYGRIDDAVDEALRLVQAEIRVDLDPPDLRD